MHSGGDRVKIVLWQAAPGNRGSKFAEVAYRNTVALPTKSFGVRCGFSNSDTVAKLTCGANCCIRPAEMLFIGVFELPRGVNRALVWC